MLHLHETEERWKKELEEFKRLENSHCDYEDMKVRWKLRLLDRIKISIIIIIIIKNDASLLRTSEKRKQQHKQPKLTKRLTPESDCNPTAAETKSLPYLAEKCLTTSANSATSGNYKLLGGEAEVAEEKREYEVVEEARRDTRLQLRVVDLCLIIR
ncbi:hypothetical protein DY000_02024982 [Brassica cretica]|uniref:Uncharacterized protein n=1 Tax=Brassica cretica TaxID=69181 RepID=A0ABQ7E2L1_BRACR|nr:hypothetical protein DY000_02024982 [Brassica cretica]